MKGSGNIMCLNLYMKDGQNNVMKIIEKNYQRFYGNGITDDRFAE